MTSTQQLTDKQCDRFLTAVLSVTTAAVCFSGSAKVFISLLQVSTFEIIFITCALFFLLRQGCRLRLKIPSYILILTLLFLSIPTLAAFDNWYSERPLADFSVIKTASLYIHIIYLLVLVTFLRVSAYGVLFFCYTLLISSSVIALFYYFYALILEVGPDYMIKNALFAANIRHTGFTVSAATLTSATLLLMHDSSRVKKSAMNVAFILNFSFLIWLGSRTGFAVTVTGLVILVMITSKKNLPHIGKRLLFSACLGTLLATISSVYDWNGPNRIQHQFQTVKAAQLAQNSVPDLSSGRVTLWQNALNAGKESIWFGKGMEAWFTHTGGDSNQFLHPHNSLIQLFLETGLVGLVIALLLFAALCRQIFYSLRHYQDNALLHTLTATLIIFSLVLLSLTSGALYFAQPLFLLSAAIAILLSLQESNSLHNAGNTHT